MKAYVVHRSESQRAHSMCDSMCMRFKVKINENNGKSGNNKAK